MKLQIFRRGLSHQLAEYQVDDSKTQQCERPNAQPHDAAPLECDLEGFPDIMGTSGFIRYTDIADRGDFHPRPSRGRAHGCADYEADRSSP